MVENSLTLNIFIASAMNTYGTGGPQQYDMKYQYDFLGRLTVANNVQNASYNVGITPPTSYDKNGNILSLTVGAVTKNYSYIANTNKVLSVSGSGFNHGYDPNGNVTQANPNYISIINYDPFTQLTQSMLLFENNISFEYGGSKQRVLKTFTASSVGEGPIVNKTLYLHGMNDYPLTEKYNTANSTTTKQYIYGPTGLIAVIQGGATYFVLKDHLGSTRAVFDGSTGAAVEWNDYMPMGNIWRSTVNPGIHYRFTGQEYDNEIGNNIHNFRARFYDSDLGRFLAMDPAGQGFGPYSYAGNNPVLFTDKDGRWFGIDDLIISVTSFVVGYFEHAFTTNQWGGQALESGAEAAVSSWLAYNTGSTVAGALFDKGSATYAISSATVGGFVGGASGSAIGQYFSSGSVDWNAVLRSGGHGSAGSFAGGVVAWYSGDPILPGIVGGGIGGAMDDGVRGFMGGAFWGAAGAALTKTGYEVYGSLTLQQNLSADQLQEISKNGRCYDLCDALTENGVSLEGNAWFEEGHIGKVLGRNLYGQDFILSKEGGGAISVLTGRQLATGSDTYYQRGYYDGKYFGGYGNYRVGPGTLTTDQTIKMFQRDR